MFFIFIVSEERQQKEKRNKFGEGGKNKTGVSTTKVGGEDWRWSGSKNNFNHMPNLFLFFWWCFEKADVKKDLTGDLTNYEG